MPSKFTIRQILTPIVGSLGVLCAGSTYVWVNPVEELLLSDESPFNMTRDDISWFGAIVELGDVIATLPSGYLADTFGRKTVLLATGPLIIATWILIQLTSSYLLLMVARILQGLAVGCIFTVTPMYLGEVSDKRVRGTVGTLVQTMWYLGIVYQYSAGPYLSYLQGINIVCVAPAVVFTLFFYFCPETPRYHIIKGDGDKAVETFAWLFGEKGDRSQLESMIPVGTKSENFLSLLVEFFKLRRCVKGLFLVSVIAITNVAGVTPILSYSTSTFRKITNADASAITIMMGGATLVATTIVATTIDRLGRRPLLLFSLTSCTFLLFAAALLHIFATGSILQALCVALYPSLMSLGPGTLTYALMAELFSDRHRGTGAALVTFVAAVATFLGLKFYNVIEGALGFEANLFILSSMSLSAIVVVYKLMPETKRRTFEEIQMML